MKMISKLISTILVLLMVAGCGTLGGGLVTESGKELSATYNNVHRGLLIAKNLREALIQSSRELWETTIIVDEVEVRVLSSDQIIKLGEFDEKLYMHISQLASFLCVWYDCEENGVPYDDIKAKAVRSLINLIVESNNASDYLDECLKDKGIDPVVFKSLLELLNKYSVLGGSK
jgi:hypothetical protein